MSKVLLCLGCLSLLLIPASPVQAAPEQAPASPVPGAVCSDVPAAGGTALFEDAGALPGVGVPTPVPRACEHNFCSISRNDCALQCAPCSYDFRCRNVACEYTCTCTC